MLRVLILGAAVFTALFAITTVSPILEGSIEMEPFVASVQAGIPELTEEALPSGTSLACIISAHPSNISRGQSANVAWGSTNASSAELSGTGAVPLQSGIGVSPLRSSTYTLTVRSSSGGFSFCKTTITVR